MDETRKRTLRTELVKIRAFWPNKAEPGYGRELRARAGPAAALPFCAFWGPGDQKQRPPFSADLCLGHIRYTDWDTSDSVLWLSAKNCRATYLNRFQKVTI